MKFYPYCGGKITIPEARFCMNCGKSLAAFQSQTTESTDILPTEKFFDFCLATYKPDTKAAAALIAVAEDFKKMSLTLTKPTRKEPEFADTAVVAGREYSIDAPMPGKIVKLVASEGASVKAGDILLKIDTITAGYTERKSIVADADGIVKKFNVKAGQFVKAQKSLVILAENFADVEVLPPAQGNDFFGEFNEASANPVSAAPAGDDFFGEANTAINNEISAAMALSRIILRLLISSATLTAICVLCIFSIRFARGQMDKCMNYLDVAKLLKKASRLPRRTQAL